jgi:hypothetical protein
MRKIGMVCLIVSAILGLCIVPSATGEAPGDPLVEIFKKDIKPKESLIPEGVMIAKDYKPGRGATIGTVKAIKGRVLAIHRDEKTAYILKKGSELFVDDTLITEKDSRAHAEFKDGSIIALGSYTKMVVDKSIYDPSKSTRDSLVRLLFGKARLIVTKLVNLRNSQVKVKTPTAVIGVRGSDFAVSVAHVNPLITTLMTGKDTTVLIAGDIGPAQVVGPMSVSTCIEGGAATAPVGISVYDTLLFKISGIPNWGYWAAGGTAAIATGFALSNGSDSDPPITPVGPRVSSISPPENSALPGLIPIDITITFNKAISPVTISNFNITATTDPWGINTVTNVNSTTVIVQVENPSSIPADGFTLELLNITGPAPDNLPLEGQNQFDYLPG